MGTFYYPNAVYTGDYYTGGIDNNGNSLGAPRTKFTGAITNRDGLWLVNGYVYARLKVDYSITKLTASITVTLQMARSNGDYGTHGTTTPYIDKTLPAYNGYISRNCTKRQSADCTVIPDSYFTTIGSTTFSDLTADNTGKFSKTIATIYSTSSSSNMNLGSQTNKTISFPGGWSDPAAPTITITDNGNNSFTISAQQGSSGINNTSTGVGGLHYKIGDDNWVSCSSGTSASISGSDKTVKGKGYTIGTYSNSEETTTDGTTVKYYVKPSSRPTPTLSYNTTRPTPKSTYTINWTAATAGNANSPIKGYRLRINKLNADGTLGPSLLGSADTASAGGGRYVEVDANSLSYSFTIGDTNTSTSIAVNPKDSIKAGLHVWAEDGSSNHNRLYYDASAGALSTALQIQNSGVMHIKVGNAWKEAIPYIKINGEWKEAVPFIKINNAWKEAT